MGNTPTTPNALADLDLLITRCLDGGAPGAPGAPGEGDDRAALNDLLRRDPAAREAFIEHCHLAALVFECPGRVQDRRVRSWELGVRNWAALAALVVLAVMAWFVLPWDASTPHSEIRTPQSPVAMLTNLDGAVFAPGSDQNPMQLGGELGPGVIRLAAGNAQLMFNSTAVVDLIGPCEFEMTGPNRGRLLRGSLAAYVPEAARGFVVEAPVERGSLHIVDLGTRFGLDVANDGPACSIVRVLEGEVELRYRTEAHSAEQRRRLRAAEGMVVRDGRFELLTPLITPQADPLDGAGAMTDTTGQADFTAGALSLHPNDLSQVGSVLTRRALALSSGAGFICTFEFECADGHGGGADWLKCFIAFEPPTAGAISSRDVPAPQVLGITFDSYRNPDEPSAAFVDVATPAGRLARIDLAAPPHNLRDLSDSGPHRVRLVWIDDHLSLSFDGRTILRDMPLKLTRPDGRPLDAAWLGFGARTGGSSELHLVRHCWFATLSPSLTSRDREAAVIRPHDSAPSGPLADARGSLKLPPTPNPQPAAPKHPENGDTP